MERDLREVISNYLILKSPFPEFMIYFLMKPVFTTFTLVIKFDCLFLASFQSFHWFVSFFV